jgi:hypothetical protein
MKANRTKFGVTGKPVRAIRAFRKDMDFDHKDTKTESWILITPENTLVRANLYNGQAGKNFDPKTLTHPAPADTKELNRKLKGYTEVSVNLCPIAEAVAQTPAAPATPAAEAPAAEEDAIPGTPAQA